MPRPEGYRKALRLMKLAEKFGLPVFTFVDTPGAYPGIGAEERGQSEAIGRNLYEMARAARCRSSSPSSAKAARAARWRSPSATRLLMLQYATYSVISPEGCASILWKTAEHAPEAAETLGITAHRLKALGLDRQDRQRAAGRRASRSRGDDAVAAKSAAGRWRQLQEQPIDDLLQDALREAHGLWQVQGNRREVTVWRRAFKRSSTACDVPVIVSS